MFIEGTLLRLVFPTLGCVGSIEYLICLGAGETRNGPWPRSSFLEITDVR